MPCGIATVSVCTVLSCSILSLVQGYCLSFKPESGFELRSACPPVLGMSHPHGPVVMLIRQTSPKDDRPCRQLTIIEAILVGGAEIYRNTELDLEKRIYPGGVFDPLGLTAASPERTFNLKTAEIKHGRLAMVAFLGERLPALAAPPVSCKDPGQQRPDCPCCVPMCSSCASCTPQVPAGMV